MHLSSTSDGQRNAVEATINPNNNLPTSTGYSYGKVMEAANTLVNTLSTTAATNTNLGPADKELLRWHNRLGHIGMRKVQFLMRTGVLATSEATWHLHAAACKLTNLPLCSACQFGKQRRRPEPGKTMTVVRERDGALKDRRLLPGQTVSVDHFVCSTMGRLFTSQGCSKDADMYTGGAIYIDMATNLVHVEFQRHLSTLETMAATAEFERMWRYPTRISFGQWKCLYFQGVHGPSTPILPDQPLRWCGSPPSQRCDRAGDPNHHEYRPDHDAACSHTLT